MQEPGIPPSCCRAAPAPSERDLEPAVQETLGPLTQVPMPTFEETSEDKDDVSVNAPWCDPVVQWTLNQPDHTANQVENFQPASSSTFCSGRPGAKCSDDISKHAKVSPQHAKPQALTTTAWMPSLARFAKVLPPSFSAKAFAPPPGLAHPSIQASNSESIPAQYSDANIPVP